VIDIDHVIWVLIVLWLTDCTKAKRLQIFYHGVIGMKEKTGMVLLQWA